MMITITLTEEEYEIAVNVAYSSVNNAHSWFNTEVKRQVYLGDLEQEKKLRNAHYNYVKKVVQETL